MLQVTCAKVAKGLGMPKRMRCGACHTRPVLESRALLPRRSPHYSCLLSPPLRFGTITGTIALSSGMVIQSLIRHSVGRNSWQRRSKKIVQGQVHIEVKDMKCEKCGHELREQSCRLGFGERPPMQKICTCMNEDCPKFNYPQKIEGLTL